MVPSDEDLQRLVCCSERLAHYKNLKWRCGSAVNDASEQDSNFLYELMILLDVHLEKTLQYLNQARGTLGLKPYDTPKAGDEKARDGARGNIDPSTRESRRSETIRAEVHVTARRALLRTSASPTCKLVRVRF